MNSAIERLLSLRVCDVMNSPVATIAETASMADAARVMAEREITGMPVVDAQGRCVGMLSATDFAMREHRLAQGEQQLFCGWEHALAKPSDEAPFQIETIAADRVSEHMSPAVQTISQSATVINAARVLCREHIHRLVIIDADDRPVGLVSSLDVVAALVAAVEE
jgi:CBS domain-containing protein